ncbi:NRR repressor homolog 2-like [Miscanthus floridulus]|uniref:NRR repressor homolog 2-like n=1 Tax=Miscanthus floridulus TaxID=154761 RepID=UPI003457F21B
MDATPGSKKAPPAAAATAVPSSAPQQAAEQSSSPEYDAAAVAGVKASGGGEDDDELVERFYALLDNIRAMRGMVSTGGSGTTMGRKRARDAEPPWRPAFRMEDFELEEVDSDSVGCAGEKKKRRESSARRPADHEEQEEGEVVEATKGPFGRDSTPAPGAVFWLPLPKGYRPGCSHEESPYFALSQTSEVYRSKKKKTSFHRLLCRGSRSRSGVLAVDYRNQSTQ